MFPLGPLFYLHCCVDLWLCDLVFTLQGVYDELSRMFVVTAVITAHGFLACFSLRGIHNGAFDYGTYIAGMLHSLLQFSFIDRFHTGLVVLKYYYILASGITVALHGKLLTCPGGNLTLLYLQCPLGFPGAANVSGHGAEIQRLAILWLG
ncbi:hypothetical protein BDZ45DRAFT_749063 [Acephala macrosclerotiorum]|nr:hypothetical protein BDZ45DRAFT_749063 [Acephala macrosclerotiorum]